MLIPSIDLMNGRIVQLVQGETLKAGLRRLRLLDRPFLRNTHSSSSSTSTPPCARATTAPSSNKICKRLPCQVGGGLKTAHDGKGPATAPEPNASSTDHPSSAPQPGRVPTKRRHKLIRLEFAESLKRELGEEALCFSVDTKAGKVAVRGWKDSVDLTPEEAVTWLEDSCAAFLYTHVDTEGTMQGFPVRTSPPSSAPAPPNSSSSPVASSSPVRDRRARRHGSRRRRRHGRLQRHPRST